MNVELDSYLGALGRSYGELVENNFWMDASLIEVYPGALTLYLQPQDGLDLAFSAETKVFESIMFTLIRLVPEETTYTGTLPEPYASCRSREDVISFFGTPDESSGPLRLPDPLGEVGGWDAYSMKSYGYERLRVIFKYDVALMVTCLSFSLIS